MIRTMPAPAPASGDRIALTGLRAFAHHGVFDHERRDGQEFVVDVTVWLDLSPAASGDALAATVHYGELAEAVTHALERDPVDLIETVAERLAAVALGFAGVQHATVTVHKPSAPITVPFDDVAVTVERRRARTAVVALGANLGDRAATLDGAVAALRATPGIRIEAVSTWHDSAAVKLDGVDDAAPRYLNGVLVAQTVLEPAALLAELQRVELVFGRARAERWGDRTLDLDLIVLDDLVSADPHVTLPHPRAHERAFVLAPWAEIAPDAVLPGHGRVADLAAALAGDAS